jgi:acyl carrier protein
MTSFADPASLDEYLFKRIASACNTEASALSLDASLLELGLDSLASQAIVAQIESTFDVELTEEEMIRLFSAERVRDFLEATRETLASASRRKSIA